MDTGVATILGGIIVGVPATMSAVAAFRASRHSLTAVKQTATSNGKTAGDFIEEIRSEQGKIAVALVQETQRNDGARQLFIDHLVADANFQSRVEPLLNRLEAHDISDEEG